MLIYNMNEILKKKEELTILKNKYEKKLFLIENELIKIEQSITKCSEDELVNTISLSEQQKLIVQATDDNILVIACPGAGKTHTLISRYVNLVLKNNIKPESILLITFTKKAGQEMLHRLEDIIPTKLPYHVGSLHGLSYRILQKYNNINYTVLDEKDTNDLLKQETLTILNSQDNLDPDEINMIKTKISTIIDQTSTTYPLNFKLILKKHNLLKHNVVINQIYKAFNKRKKLENSVDFNDLMIQFCEFLKSPKSQEFRNDIKYIFFDEYQDINPIQNFILGIFKSISKIMVVGDDAQSIYSFRGSSIKYICNFPEEFIPNNKYFLVENYRSTPAIVNFCQNIIDKNLNQFEKKVNSVQQEYGIKPSIHAFNSITKQNTGQEEQYKWIVKDIIRKQQNGVSLSNMVILARTNRALSNIELELVANKIPVIKQIGTALLDKFHIKDFLAFVIIINNPKSSVHWKRVISLHKDFSIIKANDLLIGCTNIYEKILTLSYENEQLSNLISMINMVNKTTRDVEKAKLILSYLEKIWSVKHKNIDEYKNDILSLLYYLRNTSLIDFINNLYLTQEIESTYENVLYLSTVHGAKGLEWEHVYVIDVNHNDFPYIQFDYYKDELESMEEERRLFYVACSRAKKYLTITYHTDYKTDMSPFIRELDINLYLSNNVIKKNLQLENIIPRDVTTIIKNVGHLHIAKIFEKLIIKEKSIHAEFDIPNNILKLKSKFIIGNFIDYLIPKIIQNNFSDKIKKFDLNIIHKQPTFPKKIYHEYIDENTHWNNLLTDIFYTASYNTENNTEIDYYRDFLLSNNSITFYKELENGIKKLVDMFKPKTIFNHHNINFDLLKAEIDLLFDDVIIEIKVTSYEICNIQYLCQVFTYGYLMSKKDKKINKIVLYNVQTGIIHIIDTSNFDFKLFYEQLYLINMN
jgi:DNA helicase-2/ATP-dependent DNA helicase PcrA